MLVLDPDQQTSVLLAAAESICLAARTAPKGKGKYLLHTAILTEADKDRLADRMRQIAVQHGLPSFERDAHNLAHSQVLVLIGTQKAPLGLAYCGLCGFSSCASMEQAGATCSFNTGDLGIALGSAVSRAADLSIDNRIMYTAGLAAVELGLLGKEVRIAYGLPLSVSGKNPFFDRVPSGGR